MIQKLLEKLLRGRRGPGLIQSVAVDTNFVDSCIGMGEGFPRLDGQRVNEYIEKRYTETEWAGAWTAVSKHWVDHIAGAPKEEYVVAECNHLILMGDPKGNFREFANTGDWAFEQLNHLVGDLVPRCWFGKVPVLILETHDSYYDYTGWYDPEEGRLPSSGGMFIHGYPPHVAINGYRSRTHTLVHELMHGFVAALPLPLWVNEGLAQHAEELVDGYRYLDRERHQRHVRYWARKGLQGFWDGTTFRDPKWNEAAYSLSLILLRNLMDLKKKQLPAFLLNANAEDCGAAAAKEHLGMSLEEIAATCLGDGKEPERTKDEWA